MPELYDLYSETNHLALKTDNIKGAIGLLAHSLEGDTANAYASGLAYEMRDSLEAVKERLEALSSQLFDLVNEDKEGNEKAEQEIIEMAKNLALDPNSDIRPEDRAVLVERFGLTSP